MSIPYAPCAPYAEVIGDPIAHSKSPVIHNFWAEELGIDVRYTSCCVTASDLPAYLAKRRSEVNWRGCNVTMPHKQRVIAHLDHVDEAARAIGAVNTIVRSESGALQGFNTDIAGFLEPLQSHLAQSHLLRMARIMGTGGAARAIVKALCAHNFTLVLAGRNSAKARALLDELEVSGEHYATGLSHFAEPTDFAFDAREGCLDLIVNASPLGMRGQAELAFDWSHAPPGAIAYDIVTDPVDTPFLCNARDAGHGTIDGLSMLIGQAALGFEHFFHTKPARARDDALRELLLA